ncbi:coiled-coil domain-containing protein [Sediminispirochaeta smaragdinae]|uniref:Uncharacterized protein n=1 Tax=Sediminispirochaeta smaragdinae (strain DSM 11293 / JCM 15392 / SEBR 4228) TaxID=573413 RepID=E1R3H0_SEDSS|nr:hypothetical protein [Sediminispirochaeta smaragdinae]ADK81601.1 hypothetical protein Spirs_2488 [Sediminispirochaeta smaragdinae DSM 11293]
MGSTVIDELKILLRAETRAAVKAMRDAEKQTDSLEGQLKNLAVGAAKSFGAYAAAAVSVKAVMQQMKESVKLYGVQIEAEDALAAAIRATGESADDLLPGLKEIASGIQSVTTYGDEAILSIMQLAKSQGVASDKLEEASKGAIGLANAFGINLQTSMKAVALAMNDDYTMLQRYIPQLRTATGDGEKHAIVQKAMADGFELAKAKAQNGVAAVTQLSNAVGDYKESLGRSISDGMEPFVRWLTDIVTEAANARNSLLDIKEVLDAYEKAGGTVDTKGSKALLQAQQALALEQEKLMDLQDRYYGQENEASSTIIANQEAKIAEIIATIRALGQQKQAEQELASISTEQNRIAAEAAKNNVQALELYRKRRLDAMEPNEKQLKLLQDEIDKWAAVRNAGVAAGQDMAEVQRLLNDLIDERNRKLSEGKTDWSQPLEGLSEWEQEYKDILNEASLDRQQMERDEEARLAEIRESFGKSQLQARLDEIRLQVDAAKQAGVDEVDVEKWKTEQIIQLYASRAQEAMAIYNQLNGMLSDIYSLQGDLSDAAAEKEISNLDNQIEFKKAAGETYEDLEAEKTEKEDKLARKQFERDKKNRKSETIASGAQAVINAYASMNPIAASAMAAVIAGLTARKVALINQQQYTGLADGGIVPAQGESGGLYRLGDKNKAETVIPFDIRNLKSGGTTVQVHVDSVYGPGGSEAFAKYIVQTVKRGQSSGRVEKWGA